MTTTTISNLPVLTVMTDSDAIPVDTGVNTYQISGANLKNYFGNVSLISNGTSYANIASSNGNVVISANGSGWTFDTNGDITMPLVTKLNSGGIGNTNVAEFGTDVTVDGGGNVITSEIYMGAGTAESRAIVNTLGNSLMYIGVENPGFAGSVSLDPGVTSEYAIQVGSNNEIQIGAVIGAITTTEYVAGMGVLNATGNINGLFANANVAVIGVGDQGWLFDSVGNLTAPGNVIATTFETSGAAGDLTLTNGNISGANVVSATTFKNTVIAFSALPPAAISQGSRAFINDANLVTIGNFGAEISGGGANFAPIFSDGANWCIG